MTMSSSADLAPVGTVLRSADADLVAPFRLGPGTGETAAQGSSRSSARAEGYAVGWAQGIREAREATTAARRRVAEDLDRMAREHTERATRSLRALRVAADQVHGTVVDGAEEVLGAMVTAAVELAEAMAGMTVAADLVEATRHSVRRALAELPANAPVTVRLHPADHAELAAAGADGIAPGMAVTVLPDPTVERGGAIAATEVTTVEATLSAAVRRVRAELAR